MNMKSDMWQVASDKMANAARSHHASRFTFHASRVTRHPSLVPCHPSPVTRHSQRGVALIITIILLGVVTFMAIAFLALSRRERGAVTTVTDTASARLAADAALASAEAQIMANALATTNPYNFGLLVSTNYINPAGFNPANVNPFENVNYDHQITGPPLSQNHFLTLLTNLSYSPRPPVFIPNPTNSSLPPDFRYYLDLNRNGRYDTNGWVLNVDSNNIPLVPNTILEIGDPEWIGILQRPDQPYGPNNPFVARYAFIAVPVGNTLDLNAIHNQVFDENNASTTVNTPPIVDGYFRNQGVGSWEINLAAFLADLNANQWGQVIGNSINGNNTYYYYQYHPNENQGVAFDDARALLAYRYHDNYRSLASVDNLFGGSGSLADFAFRNDNIDGYSDRPLQITLNTNEFLLRDDPSKLWAGADNTNHFFTHQELFDSTKIRNPYASPALGFTDRLLQAGTNNSTYDRYTFYRMLSQLGTDSTPESGKMNLNYDNLDPYTNSVASSTNFMAWTPLAFFTNAADRLLRAYTTQWRNSNPTNFAITFYSVPGYLFTNANFSATNFALYPAFGITNIPVLVSNRFVYSAAVNRLLQLAANMYDASTNSFYPSVFRPVFTNDGVNVFISGYQQIVSVPNPPINGPLPLPSTQLPLSQAEDVTALLKQPAGTYSNNVYGVPWIIGAKKWLPGFNQFSMVNSAQFERLLQVARDHVGGPVWTNQMIVMSVNNNLGVSFWNSYSNDYSANYPLYLGSPNLSIYVSHSVSMALTNSDWLTPQINLYTTNYTFSTNRWPGSQWGKFGSGVPAANSFFVNLWTNNFVPVAVYNFTTKSFNIVTNGPNNLNTYWDTNRTILDPLPQFGLQTTNWLQAVIVDNGHVIDYVQLRGPIDNVNLNSALKDPDLGGPPKYYLWVTNVYGGGTMPSWGIVDQIHISTTGSQNLPPGDTWRKPPNFPKNVPDTDPDHAAEAQFFWGIINPASTYQVDGVTYSNTELLVQAPYTPIRTIFVPYLYQVNDPLVHYLASDLDAGKAGVWSGNNPMANGVWDQNNGAISISFPTPPNNDIINGHSRYQPWGQLVPTTYATADYNFGTYNLFYKDPLVWSADYWDFPTNKFPTVGWIGRVHRGTPWQTVFLKANNVLHVPTPDVGTNTWMAWTGDYNIFDAANSAPLQDRLLFDLFTTAFNDNATHGTLSVNQDHLAAWSALFSGMVALTNTVPNIIYTYYNVPPTNNWLVIQPAGGDGLNSVLGNLVTNINNMRSVFTNADGVAGTFEHKGDILSVVALTEQSPFLNLTGNQTIKGISDEVYEWLPQQMMSLLRCSSSPRYVIYCYGQALKPAPDSVYTTGGPFFGMVTNYQIVSEIATRAVVRFNSTVTNNVALLDYWTNDVHVTQWFSQPVLTNNNAVIESFNILPPD